MSAPDSTDGRGRSNAALQLRLDCDYKSARHAAAVIKTFLLQRGLETNEASACELAFVEGCNNAIQNTAPDKIHHKLLVELRLEANQLELHIHDHTPGCEFPKESFLPAPETEHGRGIYLMRKLVDQVDYIRNESSNRLILKKEITSI